MNVDLALQAEFNKLKLDLQKARTKSNISIGFSVVAFVVTGCLWFTRPASVVPNVAQQPSVSTTAMAPVEAPMPENPTFDTVTAKSLQIAGPNGTPLATLDTSGLSLQAGATITITSSLGSNQITSGTMVIKQAGSSVDTYILPGTIAVDTPQAYFLSLGAFNSTPGSVGLLMYNDHYDQSHANGGTVDKTTLAITPSNISLSDSSGTERLSIGQTQLTTPSTGGTETTATSSMVLFNTSGNVVWRTP